MDCDVLIVGAGPVGLTLAADLARRGISLRVVDAAAAATRQSRALVMFAGTLESIDRLGLAEEAVKRGRPLRRAQLHSGPRVLAELRFELLRSDRFKFLLGIPQYDTESLLAEHLAARGVDVERSVRFESLSQGTGGVTSVLRRQYGSAETCRSRWVVGCDGAHSAVRRDASISFTGEDIPARFAFIDAQVGWGLDPEKPHFFPSGSGILAALALPKDDIWRVIVDLTDVPNPPAPLTPEFFRGQIRRRAGIEATIHDVRWITDFTIHQRIVDRYRNGRVLLAGDAAHAHSPAGGQGMNTGMQDALNLGWKLAMVLRGEAAERLIDSYEAERRPVAAGVLSVTGSVTRDATLRSGWGRALRNLMLRLVLKSTAFQRRMTNTISELTIHYRLTSPILGEGGPQSWGGPRPGDRAPFIAGLSTGEARHLLLCFGCEPPAVADRWAGLVAVHRVESAEARRDYDADRPCVYLVRPDGYVAYRSRENDGGKLNAFLERVFG
jgi:2-polyprenyl-6-methoxyphenol hydroxylase-like FAD-dependent oxidoreductase